MDDFSGLSRFIDVSIQNDQGHVVLHRQVDDVPEQLQHIPSRPRRRAALAVSLRLPEQHLHPGVGAGHRGRLGRLTTRCSATTQCTLAPGHYSMRLTITAVYRKLFGIQLADATRSVTLIVRKQKRGGPVPVPVRPHAHTGTVDPHQSGRRLTDPPSNGPRPDLAALPAWGMSLSKTGRYLNFSATVWNAGDSPLVVDGFREKGKAVMDSYQYFYDSAGNQVGYVPAGHMVWDPAPTHHHWHFRTSRGTSCSRRQPLRATKPQGRRSASRRPTRSTTRCPARSGTRTTPT